MQRMLTGGPVHVIASMLGVGLHGLMICVGFPYLRAAAAYCRDIAPDPGSYSSDTSRLWKGPGVFCPTACTRGPFFRGREAQ
jgi:hypothetical protein